MYHFYVLKAATIDKIGTINILESLLASSSAGRLARTPGGRKQIIVYLIPKKMTLKLQVI